MYSLGLLAGFAAIVTVGRVSSAQPYAGQGTEFDVIIAVVVGGTSLAGGSGTMLGTVLGCIIMGIISNWNGPSKYAAVCRIYDQRVAYFNSSVCRY